MYHHRNDDASFVGMSVPESFTRRYINPDRYPVRTVRESFADSMSSKPSTGPMPVLGMPSEATQQSLGKACHDGDVAKAKEAIDAGADANAGVFGLNGNLGGTATAVCIAADRGHTALLRDVLLPAPVSADPNKGTATGWTPLHIACYQQHPNVVAVLLEHGADPNNDSGGLLTPWMMAARVGSHACLRALAEGAAQQGRVLNVNAIGRNNGETALDIAFRSFVPVGTIALLRSFGSLRAVDVIRARNIRRARRKLVLYARCVGRLVREFKAAKARVAFQPGGPGYTAARDQWVEHGGGV